MKNIKSYVKFISESIDIERDIVTRFLISKERISNILLLR